MDDESEQPVVIPPMRRGRSREVGLEEAQKIKAHGENRVSYIRYLAGSAILVLVTVASLYIAIFDKPNPWYDDANRLLFLIVGGVVAALYSSNGSPSSGSE